MTRYASIVPLIGGETFAMQNVFGTPPEYILSYKDFQANDKQLLNYYNNDIPYHLLDEGQRPTRGVDVINAVCPCAGLSSLSTTSSSDSSVNDWMVRSAEYVLEDLRPDVFWGENAPRLATKMGEPIVRKMRKLARDNGYTVSIYKTRSLLHGLSQVRERTFYFFWKGDKVPLFKYYKRPHMRIEDQIRSSATNTFDPMQQMLVKEDKPSDNPYYRYVLEEMEDGISHTDFFKKISKTENVLHYFEDNGGKYNVMSKWMDKNGFDKHAKKAERMHYKLADGGNIMRRTTIVPKDYIGAFVGHQPYDMTHPDADRYLTVRECLDIMKMPKDFHLMGGVKNLNMICQNVPVTTAMDMASNVKDFLHGKAEMIEAEFLIQDNKARTYHIEKAPNTLEAFL